MYNVYWNIVIWLYGSDILYDLNIFWLPKIIYELYLLLKSFSFSLLSYLNLKIIMGNKCSKWYCTQFLKIGFLQGAGLHFYNIQQENKLDKER